MITRKQWANLLETARSFPVSRDEMLFKNYPVYQILISEITVKDAPNNQYLTYRFEDICDLKLWEVAAMFKVTLRLDSVLRYIELKRSEYRLSNE